MPSLTVRIVVFLGLLLLARQRTLSGNDRPWVAPGGSAEAGTIHRTATTPAPSSRAETARSPQPPSVAAPLPERGGAGDRPTSTGGSLLSAVGGLSVVLGLFLLAAWIMRRGTPRAGGLLPTDVLEVLGRASLGKSQLHLMRLGDRLLLVACSAGGLATLAEVSDPAEAGRLLERCRSGQSAAPSASLRHVVAHLSGKGRPGSSPAEPSGEPPDE